ncbi:chromatin-remodeling complex subunit ies6 [Puccinia graminis f. sp. tritici]|uniref:Chromatin-remodeling complex subunit ies6 n=1 Tax=Puccinia graminis f. sp. tritici TaxID=56615 RepID=A0A5B0P8P0_PUCGR|nr:chromatin-remodeling complex subunit ies6 [Puccinia graminis f. sp. tritici]
MTAAPDEQQPNSNDQQQQSQSQPAVNKKARREILGPVNPDVNYNTYMIIEAPPSVIPPKKYCDITGLEAPYIDPKSRLRYHNAEVYELIRTFIKAISLCVVPISRFDDDLTSSSSLGQPWLRRVSFPAATYRQPNAD